MINPEDEIVIDCRTSCTTDEAVAKLLGWMQGDIRHKITKITNGRISKEALPHLELFPGTIWELLTEQHENSKLAYSDAWKKKASEEDLYKLEMNIENWLVVISKAKQYHRDIDDEIAKNVDSELRIILSSTNNSNETYISLNSLDKWAMKKYGISVLDYQKSNFLKTGIDTPPAADVPKKDLAAQVADVDIDESDVKGALSKTVANNLYITFALLIEDLTKGAGGMYRHPDGRLNVANVATYLLNLAEEAAKGTGGKTTLPGQGVRTIKTHIDKAIAVKRDALK